MTHAVWLPRVLFDAGIRVQEVPGWRTRGRGFDGLRAVVWHHDASPVGNSPGVPSYMAREIDAGRAGAQLWVDRQGVWWIVAAGRVGHAGRVRPGMPGNADSLGVETDHTTGEFWPVAQLSSLRRGTAAILAHLGKDGSALHMHKTICDPPGRKVDPDGLDLLDERANVNDLLRPAPPAIDRSSAVFVVKDPASNRQYITDGFRKRYITTIEALRRWEALCPRVELDSTEFAALQDAA